MWLLLLEALAALALLLFAVWWTMFSGRRSRDEDDAQGDGRSQSRDPTDPADPADHPPR